MSMRQEKDISFSSEKKKCPVESSNIIVLLIQCIVGFLYCILAFTLNTFTSSVSLLVTFLEHEVFVYASHHLETMFRHSSYNTGANSTVTFVFGVL